MKILSKETMWTDFDQLIGCLPLAIQRDALRSICESHEALRAELAMVLSSGLHTVCERDECALILNRLVPVLRMTGLSNHADELLALLKKYEVKP